MRADSNSQFLRQQQRLTHRLIVASMSAAGHIRRGDAMHQLRVTPTLQRLRTLAHVRIQIDTSHSSSLPRVSGKRYMSMPPKAKNTAVNDRAVPIPRRSAMNPIVAGAKALTALPTL